MKHSFPGWREREGCEVRYCCKGELGWHCVACSIVYGETDEEEQNEIGKSVDIGVDKCCPALWTSERKWRL